MKNILENINTSGIKKVASDLVSVGKNLQQSLKSIGLPDQQVTGVVSRLINDALSGQLNEINDEVLRNFIKQYGEKKGEKIYYATANKQNRDPKTFEKNENKDELKKIVIKKKELEKRIKGLK